MLQIGCWRPAAPHTLQQLNALKNVLTLGVNAVAALNYVVVAADRIDWRAAGLVAAGSLVGGFLGGRYGRTAAPLVAAALAHRRGRAGRDRGDADVSWVEWVLLLAAGVGGGLTGSIAGLARW